MFSEIPDFSGTYKKDFCDHLFKHLQQVMARAQTGAKFKRELMNAMANGFPIDYKYNSFGKQSDGDTLLHESLLYKPKTVQVLLDLRADVNIENHNGMNALLIAAYNFNGAKVQYFPEIISKTNDLDKIPRQLRMKTTALGILCRQYCTSQSQAIMSAIKLLLDAGANIEAAGDWSRGYYGSDKERYYQVVEKLKGYIAMYVQQKSNFKNEQEYAGYESYDYEI